MSAVKQRTGKETVDGETSLSIDGHVYDTWRIFEF